MNTQYIGSLHSTLRSSSLLPHTSLIAKLPVRRCVLSAAASISRVSHWLPLHCWPTHFTALHFIFICLLLQQLVLVLPCPPSA